MTPTKRELRELIDINFELLESIAMDSVSNCELNIDNIVSIAKLLEKK